MTTPYQLNAFKNPIFTVDSVLFAVNNGALNVLLVKRSDPPFQNQWGLPGGFMDINNDQSAEETASRKIVEKTGATPQYLEQLHTFSSPNRDPRGFSVTLSFFAMIAYQKVSSTLESIDEVNFIDIKQIKTMALAFDHNEIITLALRRIKQKALYSMVPAYCLPQEFTLTEYKHIIETIVGHDIQRKSLIRRVNESGMFVPLNKTIASGKRPAQLFQLKENIAPYYFNRTMAE